MEHKNEVMYGATVPYEEAVSLVYPDFTVTYQGIRSITANGVEISLQAMHFLLEAAGNQSIQLEIGNGQLPNEPYQFSFAQKHFILYTYRDPDGNKLVNQLVIIQVDQGPERESSVVKSGQPFSL